MKSLSPGNHHGKDNFYLKVHWDSVIKMEMEATGDLSSDSQRAHFSVASGRFEVDVAGTGVSQSVL